ncbi:hemolysin family protein [Frigoribacterium faeni]|uniref:CBS domain containing-hemolysin-like protein n=2 Tax=Frigoribacterium faeni TaxID=145483 RepID=A0A7W3JFK8_9MICO|nr:hemolysin family protein [Frigoribacterium faeni]MBA8811944.1 CBS domain containing-hemolysin-like protein [Frigoribacterium faeni]BFF12935.1 hemolysin family protein [Microbacterium flavescens]
MNEWVMLGIGLILTVGTGLFVASEFSLVNLDRSELEAREARGEKRLAPTIKALRITSTHLSGAQLGITLTTLLTGYTFEPAISSMLSGPLTGLGVPSAIVPGIGAVVGIALATLFSMVIGELVPKNFALALPLATAKLVVPFQAAFTTVFRPVIVLFNNTANAVIRSMGIEPKEELSGARSADELSSLVRRSALEGLLDQDHATLLGRTLRFSEHTAVDVMTPRVRMTTVRATDSAADIVEASLASGFSRFPVIGDDSDDIVGVVHVKQAFALPVVERDGVPVSTLVSDARFVPESMGIDTLLGLLRREGYQIAVVTDEFGGTAGLVTLEDLVEELVGELEDEHDRARVGIVRSKGTVVFDASLRPDELLDRAAVRVPDDGDYETVAGFVAERLDRLPEVGDEVEIETGTLRVERVVGQRLERLRFVPRPSEATSASVPATDHDRVVAGLREDLTR